MDRSLVRSASLSDAAAIARIYNHFIEHSRVTFETSVLKCEDIEVRMEQSAKQYPWLVFEREGVVRGYAYAGPYHKRAAYGHTVEVSVYVENGFEGNRIGSRLYERLFDLLGQGDFHVAVAAISLPNEGSVILHERFGMTQVAHFREVGRKFEEWIDVGHWQRAL